METNLKVVIDQNVTVKTDGNKTENIKDVNKYEIIIVLITIIKCYLIDNM